MNDAIHKQGQLLVVVVGFFATVQILITQGSNGAASATRVALTFAVALACAVRYWWVILQLPWPFEWPRVVLLLSAWSALAFIAMSMRDDRQWVLALAGLSLIGVATEVYNGITGQWKVGGDSLSRSLKRDHVGGAVMTAGAAVILATGGLRLGASTLDWLVSSMIAADWIRLVLMIRRHRMLLLREGET